MAEHIPGVRKTAADVLSQNNLTLVLSFFPSGLSHTNPTDTHEDVGFHQPDWGSTTWINVIHEYLDSSIASSTVSTYCTAVNRYLHVCFCYNLSVSLFPLCQIVVPRFVAYMYLAKSGVVHSSIRSYLNGLCFIPIRHGLPDQCIMSNSLLHYVLCGVHWCSLSHSWPPRMKCPQHQKSSIYCSLSGIDGPKRAGTMHRCYGWPAAYAF